mmetsp:Transcript_54857/g.132286  ORF Transcript_54857/g.132286 Transcript_54857/m.132286 type:complete len:81 (-) Transcript_54857:220-462(-)
MPSSSNRSMNLPRHRLHGTCQWLPLPSAKAVGVEAAQGSVVASAARQHKAAQEMESSNVAPLPEWRVLAARVRMLLAAGK